MAYMLLAVTFMSGMILGCSSSNNPAGSQETSPVQLVMELDPATIVLPPPPIGSIPVNVGFFLSVHIDSVSVFPSEEEAVKVISQLLGPPSTTLGQCNVHLVVEVAQVIALPEHLLRIQGNHMGSWGGHPPREVENTELFTYEQNERLTEDSRILFAYGKRYTSPNTVAIFTVEQIIYFVAQDRVGAGGLSFPPNAFHHPEDYPYRNSVLVLAHAPFTDLMPLTSWRITHELGHMLLNVSDHSTNNINLMNSGWELSSDQCSRMDMVTATLFGEQVVADPGSPVSP